MQYSKTDVINSFLIDLYTNYKQHLKKGKVTAYFTNIFFIERNLSIHWLHIWDDGRHKRQLHTSIVIYTFHSKQFQSCPELFKIISLLT